MADMSRAEAIELAAQALVRNARNACFNLCLINLDLLEELHDASPQEARFLLEGLPSHQPKGRR